jgi:hypothetical protein
VKASSLFAAALLTVLIPGCRKKEQPVVPPSADPHQGMAMTKRESTVMIPESQKGKWKAAQVTVLDLASRHETTHVVPFDTDFPLPGTGLTLRLSNPLADFVMGDGVITSKSDKLENPAAQVRIQEGGQEVFKGWLFTKHPDTHAFQHPQFALRMGDFVPAR